MKIQLKITQSSSSFSNEKRFNKLYKDQPSFSPLPKVNYEPVVKEKERIRIKSITAMKAFAQYSFEELRMFTPMQQKISSDLITAKDSGDLCYSVTWTPECASNFVINIIIDGVQVNENYTISVINANIPPPVKEHALKKIQPQYKYRKFFAEYSAGLRVRLHPTLQADQIGVIKINDVISYIDEIENNDGIWVKLSTDSIRKFCSTSWCSSEAWCLAYNKHFNKRLLYSLIEPNKEKSTPNPKDDMNNVKSFEEENVSVENEQEDVKKVDDATSSNSDRDEDDKPPMFEEFGEESADKTSQSNITAAIAGVVEGSANKLQAFQKWLRRDSIGETNTVQRRHNSIPEAYNNNTLDLKKTNIDNLADKLSNDIITSPLVERIIPTSRVNRNYDKENFTSKNSVNSPTNSEAKNRRQLDYDENNTPKQALSPSVAETIRAIFAAFLWHEGLVHDAIACASFLKFHPSIPKNNVFEMDQTIVEQRFEALTKEDKIQQRHSVEIINTTNYLNARPSTLEALTKSGYCCVHRRQRGKAKEVRFSNKTQKQFKTFLN
jgi:RCR-type E3 ubiquitin transferase